MKASKPKQRRDPELFLNRELSWLEFDGRVLEEAEDGQNPALERLKFATIVASNLDEFVMVRVAALQNAVEEEDASPDSAGLSPAQQLQAISERTHELVDRLYATLTGAILPALQERGIRIASVDGLETEARAAVQRHFRDEVLPALTPLAIDASRPFPLLASLSLNVAVLLAPAEGRKEPRLAVVQVPARLRRLVRLPLEGAAFALLEDVIRAELQALFPGQQVIETATFRVARDAELDLDDEGGRDFLEAVEEELRKRRKSRVVRLEIEKGASEGLVARLAQRLEVGEQDVYRVPGLLDVRALVPLVELPALEDLRDPPLKPVAALDEAESERLFERIERGDVLLHHPYEAFDPVVSFVAQAAEDPGVLAIKQTLYRTSGESPIVRALARAAENGKQVTVLVELTARFDEHSNIRWARSLEEAGAHVIYGVRGYKTHAKACLVVRRGRAGIRRYVHLGTGNYNEKTARVYTDFGLMTVDPDLGRDASAFFNALTGYSDPPEMKKLVMAPTQLRDRVLALIQRETRRAGAGEAGLIQAKMNSLVDEDIIRALYAASQAGVRVRLNVRGICCLRPGLKGVSETIEVVSIVDRFLEHARIFHFRNGGDEEVYLASADWMPRNLDKRVELLFPVEAPEARAKVLHALEAAFQDNVKARRLQPDGSYRRRRPAKGEEPFRMQIQLHREAVRAQERARAAAGVVLEPIRAPGREAS
ncbi:MAG TPA: polyphosphate kinase 1 [Vicinamibacteria bacterium]|nr:polyphosphate kinase 1 [Vicinamibacteria bacterium]